MSLTLGNYSESPARRRLSVSAGDKNVLTRELDVPPGVSSLTLPLPAGLPAVRVALSDDALLRDNEVMLAEPRPRVVGVENRLPDGRGRQALVKALGAVAGVTHAESGHLVFAEARSARSASAARRVARRVRPRASGMARDGRAQGFHRSVRAGEAPSSAPGHDARRSGVAGSDAACGGRRASAGLRGRSGARRHAWPRRPARGPSLRFSSTSISIAPISFDRQTGRS